MHGVYFVPGDEPVIEILMKDGNGHLPVSMETYRDLEQKVLPLLRTDREYFIDQNWAAEFLAEENTK